MARHHSACLAEKKKEVGSMEEGLEVETVRAFGLGYCMNPSNIGFVLKLLFRALVCISCTGAVGKTGQ
jgi:hypothetical protein